MKTNIALISTVGVLLIIATLVLIKILFADVNGFEWGSFTDWLSAVGTFGTFIIAIIALMKVPDWMEQKHYDIAYSLIENAVFKELANVSATSVQLRAKTSNITRRIANAVRNSVRDTKSNLNRIDELYESFQAYHKDFNQSVNGIINQLKAITRTEYYIAPYTQEIINQLQTATKKYNNINYQIINAIAEIEDFYDYSEGLEITEIDIYDIRKEIIETNKELSEFIAKIYTENLPIKDFITRKKKQSLV